MIQRRILAAVALLCLVATPSHAQSTKAQLNTLITTQFPNNTTGAITPTILRNVTSSIVNSIMPTAPVVSGNLACFNGTTGLLQDCGVSPSSNPLIVGTTPIASGTPKGLLYNNGGVLGNFAAGNPVFNVAAYASVAAAITAARAAGNGNTVWVPCGTYNFGSGATGLDLTGASALHIAGPGGVNAGAGQCVTFTYSGTGTMINADTAFGLEISGIYLLATGAGAKIINGDNSFSLYVHDNVIVNSTSNASNLGVTLDNSQGAQIIHNGIAVSGGVGIRGVAPTGSFSIKTTISRNMCFTSTDVCVSAPGQAWTISENISQNPATNFIKSGPATTCDILNVISNDIDDIVGTKTIITSNCVVLNSIGNRFAYTSGTITNISQANSTGNVNSIGDRLSGTVGIDIGIGNNLSIEVPAGSTFAPTTLYTGTPANTDVIKTIGGATNITGKLSLGLTGATAGALRFYNATSGYVELVTPAGTLGTNTVTVPAFSGDTLAVLAGAQVLTNKTMSGASNTFSNIPISTAISGLGTGVVTALGVNVGSAGAFVVNGGALGTPSSGNGSNITNVNAATITLTDDTTTDATSYSVWTHATPGNENLHTTSSKFTINPLRGTVAIGSAPAANSTFQITNSATALTGGTQTAFTLAPTCSTAATVSCVGAYVVPTTADGSYTTTSAYGLYIDDVTRGVSNTITTQYQLYLKTPTKGGTNYAIYSAGGTNFFGGEVKTSTYVQTGAVAVGSLPSCAAGTKGSRHFVTDANATFTAGIGAVVAAGGANNVPVTCDGTNWRIGANDNSEVSKRKYA